MKQIIIVITALLFSGIASGQEKSFPNVISDYFKEMATSTKKNRSIWDKNLYGSTMLVDPETRQIYANMPDAAGELTLRDGIYTGILPQTQHISNTYIHWNGTDWAMVILPLPENKYDRISLLAHERFHVVQSELGFTFRNDDCIHLDSKDGRIYLRLELEALKEAVSASSNIEVFEHLTAAFIFRKYRQSLFPEANQKENELELNEGIAEYTGEASCGRPEKEKVKHFIQNMDEFMQNPTFIRSFAYQTIPVYGYLLDKSHRGWNRSINRQTNLTDFFMNAFNIGQSHDIETEVLLLQQNGIYNSATIITEEVKREEDRQQLIAKYKEQFVEQPHFEIAFEQMKIQFDPRNIIPLEDKGTVYPNIEVIDNWGILHITKGALMSPNWNKITVTPPENMDGRQLSGNGWTLELNEGYSVVIINRNFKIKKVR